METLYLRGVNGWQTVRNITVDESIRIHRNIRKRRKNHKPAPIEFRVVMSNGDVIVHD